MLLSRGEKTGLVLLDGPAPPAELLEAWLAEADLFIAADGAGGRPLPLPPEAIVGDLDSLGEAPADVPIVKDEDPSSTDAEKCLRFLEGEGCDRFVFLGGYGARPDHSLVNLTLPLSRPGAILLADGDFAALGLEGHNAFDLPPGRILSIFPLQEPVRGLTLTGCDYPIDNMDLDSIRGLTASNRVLDSRVEIEVLQGRLLLIVERRAGDPLWRRPTP